jgi:hypothetical protein
MLAKIIGNEDAENDQSNDFLNHLELDRAKVACADAIGGHLEAILKKGDHPAYNDHLPQRFLAESEMSVPRKRHEDVGDNEKNDCPHS